MCPGGKGGRCVGLTTLPPSCAYCLKIPGASNSWRPRGLSRRVQGELYLYHSPSLRVLVKGVMEDTSLLTAGWFFPGVQSEL